MRKLYRFKSNTNTIVTEIPDSNLVKIVWTNGKGTLEGFIYSKIPENLIELTPDETKEIENKILEWSAKRIS